MLIIKINMVAKAAVKVGILHSPVYTFFEKACIIELNGDVETENSKSTKCKLLLTCREGCLKVLFEKYSSPYRYIEIRKSWSCRP